jgi:CBS domain-containing protein
VERSILTKSADGFGSCLSARREILSRYGTHAEPRLAIRRSHGTRVAADRGPSTEMIYKFGAMEGFMQVSEAMSTDVKITSPSQSIRDAARTMAEIDAGILPVGENDRLVGMITDRDIAIRAVAAGKDPSTPVREVMSREVKYCFDDDDLEDVAQNMGDLKVRRLPVLNKQKRIIGILSIGDMALAEGPKNAGDALCGISEPGGAHSQSGGGVL